MGQKIRFLISVATVLTLKIRAEFVYALAGNNHKGN